MGFFFVLFFMQGLMPSQASIQLKEDELILPPYVKEFKGGGVLNVLSSIQNKKREVKAGEWIEFGDSFDLPSRLSVHVLLRENIQWTGGGIFQAQMGRPTAKSEQDADQVHLRRGWMKVWVKPERFRRGIRIHTKNTSLVAENAIFWVNYQNGNTEVYHLEGETRDTAGHVLKGKVYAVWRGLNGDQTGPQSFSQDWKEGPWLVQLASLFPSLVKLSDQAQEDWTRSKSEKLYSDLRRKGWKKSSRFKKEKFEK